MSLIVHLCVGYTQWDLVGYATNGDKLVQRGNHRYPEIAHNLSTYRGSVPLRCCAQDEIF